MHIVLVYRYYNDGIVYYNLTFCTKKSLMTDLGLTNLTWLSVRYTTDYVTALRDTSVFASRPTRCCWSWKEY